MVEHLVLRGLEAPERVEGTGARDQSDECHGHYADAVASTMPLCLGYPGNLDALFALLKHPTASETSVNGLSRANFGATKQSA